LTARTNDEGWASVFRAWLEGSHLNAKDAIMVFSVGVATLRRMSVQPGVGSTTCKGSGCKNHRVVGRDGGYTAQVADACVIIPTIDPDHVTPQTEAFHSVVHTSSLLIQFEGCAD